MARIIVRHPVALNHLVADPSGVTVWGEGLDQIEPTVTITPMVKATFATKASRVHFKGPEYEGDFKLVDDWAEMELRGNRLVAHHFCVYEFQGWTRHAPESA